jgi:hypothetical protein
MIGCVRAGSDIDVGEPQRIEGAGAPGDYERSSSSHSLGYP